MNNKKIAIIGSGALGTALAKILHDAKQEDVIVYGIDQAELNDLSSGKNSKYFPGIEFPHFQTTNDLKKALNQASYIVLATPSKTIALVVKQILPLLNSEVVIINGSKGFYAPGLLLHNGIAKDSKKNPYVKHVVSLIGPAHAEEMVLGIPTAVCAVNEDLKKCREIQELFRNDYFRVYAQTDVLGATAASAYKNVLAIASGFTAAMGGGINTTALLLTRGLAEMTRFIKIEGGKAETAVGLTGIGDLIVTATSELSRNYTFGKQLAKNSIDNIQITSTIEGIEALKYIYPVAKAKKVELPIAKFMYELIIEKSKKPESFKEALWKRELREE